MLITVYHNPSCSKSCKALSILDDQGVNYHIRDYLSDPPNEEELRELLAQLNIGPLELLRKNEPLFIENYADSVKTDDEWISIMCKFPVLIERPVLTNGRKAIIGRPAETIAEFLK